jgi:hypothetical protein
MNVPIQKAGNRAIIACQIFDLEKRREQQKETASLVEAFNSHSYSMRIPQSKTSSNEHL